MIKTLATLLFGFSATGFASVPDEHWELLDEVMTHCQIHPGQTELDGEQVSCLEGIFSQFDYPDIRCQGEGCDQNKTEEQHCRDFSNSLRSHASDMGARSWDSQTQPNDKAGAETHFFPALYDIGCGFESAREKMRYRCKGQGSDSKRKEPPPGRPNPNGIPLS